MRACNRTGRALGRLRARVGGRGAAYGLEARHLGLPGAQLRVRNVVHRRRGRAHRAARQRRRAAHRRRQQLLQRRPLRRALVPRQRGATQLTARNQPCERSDEGNARTVSHTDERRRARYVTHTCARACERGAVVRPLRLRLRVQIEERHAIIDGRRCGVQGGGHGSARRGGAHAPAPRAGWQGARRRQRRLLVARRRVRDGAATAEWEAEGWDVAAAMACARAAHTQAHSAAQHSCVTGERARRREAMQQTL
jgi:hypothetical protein